MQSILRGFTRRTAVSRDVGSALRKTLCTKQPKSEVLPLSPLLMTLGWKLGGQHQARTQSRGPLGWVSLGLAGLVGGSFVVYFNREKDRITRGVLRSPSPWCELK